MHTYEPRKRLCGKRLASTMSKISLLAKLLGIFSVVALLHVTRNLDVAARWMVVALVIVLNGSGYLEATFKRRP